jgi:uncharacterized protein
MNLYVKIIPGKGRGVFCDVIIRAGELIEECPVIVCPPQDRTHIDQTNLYNYYFLWHDDHQSTAIALGFGSLYNHSYQPNSHYETYYEDEIIRFIALSDIPADTEITVNYNHDPEDQTKVWFDKS